MQKIVNSSNKKAFAQYCVIHKSSEETIVQKLFQKYVKNKSSENLKKLAALGLDLNKELAKLSCWKKDDWVKVKFLLQAGALVKPVYKSLLNSFILNDRDCANKIEELIDLGITIDIEEVDEYGGNTVLLLACMTQRISLLNKVLDLGADAKVTNKNNEGPLFCLIAIDNNKVRYPDQTEAGKAFKKLLDKGATVENNILNYIGSKLRDPFLLALIQNFDKLLGRNLTQESLLESIASHTTMLFDESSIYKAIKNGISNETFLCLKKYHDTEENLKRWDFEPLFEVAFDLWVLNKEKASEKYIKKLISFGWDIRKKMKFSKKTPLQVLKEQIGLTKKELTNHDKKLNILQNNMVNVRFSDFNNYYDLKLHYN